MSKLTDSIAECVRPIIEELGMQLVDVEEKKLYGERNIFVYIDKDSGIMLDDCESVHKAIDAPLDEIDPTDGQGYILNVSSPGLDRPFKTDKDFLKNVGEEVEVSLFKPIDKLKKFEAVLVAYDSGAIELKHKQQQIKLNIKDIALMRAVIKF